MRPGTWPQTSSEPSPPQTHRLANRPILPFERRLGQAIACAGIDPNRPTRRTACVRTRHLRPPAPPATAPIVHQTRHGSLATLGRYVRISEAWVDNAPTKAPTAANARPASNAAPTAGSPAEPARTVTSPRRRRPPHEPAGLTHHVTRQTL